MPRQGRKASRSNIYHIMVRGNERKDIFLDDDDRLRFLDIIIDKNKKNNFCLYAYCLMDNHVHLLINIKDGEPGQIMKSIQVRYAYYFNKKYGRIGHLFQDRYKSEVVEDEKYLLAAVRYIHNNPVKADMVKEPSKYKWSSYSVYLNEYTYTKSILDIDYILQIFSKNEDRSRKMFIEYSLQESEDCFIEYKDTTNSVNGLLNGSEAAVFITEFLNKKKLSFNSIKLKGNISTRNELIRELKSNSNLSVREIADMLGVGRNIVQKLR